MTSGSLRISLVNVFSAPAGSLRLRVLAPAKLNLGLYVTGRRADGLHHIVSNFYSIDWADELHIQDSDEFSVSAVADHEAVSPELISSLNNGDTILHRCWQAWQEHAQAGKSRIPEGLSIRLIKRIPSPAGLGGASTDAAALLRYLAGYAGVPADEMLWPLALGIGADIPFCLSGRPALVSGIGEPVEYIANANVFYGIIAVPAFGFPTGAMYAALKKPLQADIEGSPDVLQALGACRDLPRLAAAQEGKAIILPNDFESAAATLYPDKMRQLIRQRDLLLQALTQVVRDSGHTFNVAAGMTGSGSAVYALTAAPIRDALAALAAVHQDTEWVWQDFRTI